MRSWIPSVTRPLMSPMARFSAHTWFDPCLLTCISQTCSTSRTLSSIQNLAHVSASRERQPDEYLHLPQAPTLLMLNLLECILVFLGRYIRFWRQKLIELRRSVPFQHRMSMRSVLFQPFLALLAQLSTSEFPSSRGLTCAPCLNLNVWTRVRPESVNFTGLPPLLFMPCWRSTVW